MTEEVGGFYIVDEFGNKLRKRPGREVEKAKDIQAVAPPKKEVPKRQATSK